MKKIQFIALYIFLLIFFLFSEKKISDITTVLIIIEEKENGNVLNEETPISEGIFESLWDNQELIFFDMKIESPLNFNDNNLDIKPFIEEAKKSGADSILLIKIDYSIEENKNNVTIKVKEYYYNLYSINYMKSLRIGKKDLIINEKIDVDKKKDSLKKIGIRIINEIYK